MQANCILKRQEPLRNFICKGGCKLGWPMSWAARLSKRAFWDPDHLVVFEFGIPCGLESRTRFCGTRAALVHNYLIASMAQIE